LDDLDGLFDDAAAGKSAGGSTPGSGVTAADEDLTVGGDLFPARPPREVLPIDATALALNEDDLSEFPRKQPRRPVVHSDAALATEDLTDLFTPEPVIEPAIEPVIEVLPAEPAWVEADPIPEGASLEEGLLLLAVELRRLGDRLGDVSDDPS
jgi:hypothetical protein